MSIDSANQDENKQPKPNSAPWRDRAAKTVIHHAITVVGSVVTVLALVWMLLGAGQGFKLEMDGFMPKLVVDPKEESLGRIIDSAIERDERDTRGILYIRNFHHPDSDLVAPLKSFVDTQREVHRFLVDGALRDLGYYQANDPALITELEKMPPTSTAARSLRRLLFEMKGPFQSPETFEGAHSQFLADLLDKRSSDDMVVAEIWSRFVARSLSFLYPDLSARLVPANIPVRLERREGGVVLNAASCGTALTNKFIQLWKDNGTEGEEHSGFPAEEYIFFVSETLPFNQCLDEPTTLVGIVQSKEAKLGLPWEIYRELFEADTDSDDHPARYSFVIFPDGVAPLGPPWRPQQTELQDVQNVSNPG